MLIKYDRLPVRMIHDDVVESYKIIEENLGNKDLKVFAYPYGAYTKEISKVFLEPLRSRYAKFLCNNVMLTFI